MHLPDENIQNMIGFYKEMFDMKKQSKQLYRYLKLNLLTEPMNISANINKIKKKNFFANTRYWTIINEFKSIAIITGSLSLKAFGFLERKVADVDLIVQPDDLDSIINSPGCRRIDKRYPEDCVEYMVGSFVKKENIIDLYLSKTENIIDIQGFRFQNPYEILKRKLDIFMDDGNTKHFQDIKFYFSSINKKSIFLDQ